MEWKFIPVDYDYFDFEGRNYVRLVGRTDKGEKICVIDSYEPNFWVILKERADAKKIEKEIQKASVKKAGRETRVLKTKILKKRFLGKDVEAIQVFVTNHKDAHDIASEIGEIEEIKARREYDIPLITKYIKEKKVLPLHWYTVKGEVLTDTDYGGLVDSLELKTCIDAEKIVELKEDLEFRPKILSYDIETNDGELGKGDILMIALYGEGYKKVLTWKGVENNPSYVLNFESEAEMLKGFVSEVKKFDPDIMTGYFSDGFDLPYLKHNAGRKKVKLSLGIDGKGPSFSRGRIPTGKISGIVHLDVYRFISAVFSQYLQSETLSLNEVAKELIGEEKEDFDFARLAHMKDEDWLDFFSYNLQDANVTYQLAEKIWPDLLEFTRVVKEPLFEVSRDRVSSQVENYLIHNLDRFNEIVEKRPLSKEIGDRRMREKYEGAFVFEPTPGLYEKVVMFDFTSFWPSIIVSYNLSRSTHLEEKEKDSEEVSLGKGKMAYFSKEKGFFPEMLSEIIDLRKKYKKEYAENKSNLTKARSNAYKLLANASYGYQGFFGARYYCPEASASATAISRDFIHKTIEKIESHGHKILYGDTDSIAFLQGDKMDSQVLKMLKEINKDLPGIMELDLEDFYKRGIFVSGRNSNKGAKKKYSLLDSQDKLKIRGFETVRRDWCKLTRNLQSEILERVLKDGNEKAALKLLKETVEDLKKRKVGMDELVIKTQLRRPIGEYLSEGPHVAAAKKMENSGIKVSQGMIIEYFIGEKKGAKKISDRVYLLDEKADYDIDYYLNNQVLPAVENIFEVFGIKVAEVIAGESQKTLF